MPIVRWFIGDTQQNTPYFCYPIGLPRQFSNCTLLTVFRWAPPPPTSEWRGTKGIFWETFVSPPLAQEKGTPWWRGGGGDGTKKIKKTYKLSFFFSKKGAGTGSTRLWLEGGACSTRFIIGPLQGFYMAHVAEPPHYFQQLWWCTNPPKATNPLYFSKSPPKLSHINTGRSIYFYIGFRIRTLPEFELPSPHPTTLDPPLYRLFKASDQCLKGRWFESTPRQPSVHMPAHTLRIISR